MRLLLFIVSLTVIVQPSYSASLPTFSDVTDKTGFDYFGKLADQGKVLDPAAHDNEGVYVADYNNDHWPDVLAVGDSHPRLFRNEGGSFVPEKTFPTIRQKIMGALWIDYNQNDWPDLVLIPMHGRVLLVENHQGNFSNVREVGSSTLDFGFGATAGDFNHDGCPDLLVLQYEDIDEHNTSKMARFRRGREHREIPEDNANENILLRGDCRTFTEVKDPSFNRKHWSLAASFVDITGNGYQDIHVANDYYLDSLYLNQGDSTFEHRYLDSYTNRNGMASELLDYNHDGRTDIFVSNIFVEPNSKIIDPDQFRTLITSDPEGHNLLINRYEKSSSSIFEDHAKKVGIQKGGWGWAASWGDFDLDFDRELLLGRSNLLRNDVSLQFYRLDNFEVARNVGQLIGNQDPPPSTENLDFISHAKEWLGYPAYWDRTDTSFRRVSHKKTKLPRLDARGLSRLDYDQNGTMDLLVSQRNKDFILLKNEVQPDDQKNWVKFHVEDTFIGGTLRLKIGEKKRVIPLSIRSDFSSQETPLIHSGLGDDTSVDRVRVRWNSGESLERNNIPANRIYKIRRPSETNKKGMDTEKLFFEAEKKEY